MPLMATIPDGVMTNGHVHGLLSRHPRDGPVRIPHRDTFNGNTQNMIYLLYFGGKSAHPLYLILTYFLNII